MDLLVPLFFGWPAVLLSLALSAAGIVLHNPWLVVAGGLLVVPFSFYLSGQPAIRQPGLLLPLFQLWAAWALHRKKNKLTWFLLTPLVMVSLLLAAEVLRQ